MASRQPQYQWEPQSAKLRCEPVICPSEPTTTDREPLHFSVVLPPARYRVVRPSPTCHTTKETAFAHDGRPRASDSSLLSTPPPRNPDAGRETEPKLVRREPSE